MNSLIKKILSSALRKLNFFFFFKLNFYLAGMVLFRLSRKIRNKVNQNKTSSQFEITKNCLGSMKIKLDINSYMGGCIYWSGLHHVNESIYLSKILKKDYFFIDIGANQGEFSLFASKYIKSGKILSFEPVKENFERLKTNLELNQITNCKIFNYGLSDTNCILPVYTDTSAKEGGGINEGLSTIFKSENKNFFEEQIELKVFDEIFGSSIERIDFIKIDIEGSELFALKGLEKSIIKHKPEILIEINEECFHSAGYTSFEISSFFNRIGYEPYKLYRGNTFKHEGEFKDWGNYIFKFAKL